MEAACDWRMFYLLLCFDNGAALRFSAPAIRWFIPLRTKKANSLSAANVVPVHKDPSLKFFIFSQMTKKNKKM